MFLRHILKGFILFFVIIICLFVVPLFLRDYDYPTGRDTHAAYDNGRFQVARGGNPITYSLFDMEQKLNLIYDIEKYYKKGQNIYFTGYFIRSKAKIYLENKVNFWTSINPQTGVKTRYTNIEDIPKYSIFNYETGAVELYKTLDEVPEKERKYFEKNKYFLYIWCYFRGVCFDKNRTY